MWINLKQINKAFYFFICMYNILVHSEGLLILIILSVQIRLSSSDLYIKTCIIFRLKREIKSTNYNLILKYTYIERYIYK